MRAKFHFGLMFFVLTTLSANAQSGKILVAAASDLKFALDSVVSVFGKDHNCAVEVTYGSSGKLSEQITHGAPFDLFFSADISYPERLQDNGLTASEIYPYGVGRIVIWSKRIDPAEGMNALLSPRVKKIAIANPAHAPYGKRAEEALLHEQLMQKVKDKLVFGENISQTAQFVTTGAADAGIIALSLALSPNMKRLDGKYYLIPEEFHQPLKQGAVVLSHGKDNGCAKDFLEFLKGQQADSILRCFGFVKPVSK